MQGGVAEGRETEIAPDADKLRPTPEDAERGDRKRGDQEADRPCAGEVQRLVDRPRPEVIGERALDEPERRQYGGDQRRTAQPRKCTGSVAPQGSQAETPRMIGALYRRIGRKEFHNGVRAREGLTPRGPLRRRAWARAHAAGGCATCQARDKSPASYKAS